MNIPESLSMWSEYYHIEPPMRIGSECAKNCHLENVQFFVPIGNPR